MLILRATNSFKISSVRSRWRSRRGVALDCIHEGVGTGSVSWDSFEFRRSFFLIFALFITLVINNTAVAPPSSTKLAGLSALVGAIQCRRAPMCVLPLLLFIEGDLYLQFRHKQGSAARSAARTSRQIPRSRASGCPRGLKGGCLCQCGQIPFPSPLVARIGGV